MNTICDVIILGSGPAGYTCAIYGSRGGLKILVLTGNQIGGQLTLTEHIENYPGFPDGITGNELMKRMRVQAEKFGTEVVVDYCQKMEKMDGGFKIMGGKNEYFAKTVVVATGASALWLPAPGVGEFKGKGISACATCDGPFFKDKTVCVIGGGDTAFLEVEFLIRFAKRIYLIHRRENFRAEKIIQDRVLASEKVIPLYNTQVLEFLGSDKLEAVKLESKFSVENDSKIKEVAEYPNRYGQLVENNQDGFSWRLSLEGAFMAIGHKPNTEFLQDFLKLDKGGYIFTKDEVFTSVEGVFACGDVVGNIYKQATIAVGSGCKAAIEVQNYLRKKYR